MGRVKQIILQINFIVKSSSCRVLGYFENPMKTPPFRKSRVRAYSGHEEIACSSQKEASHRSCHAFAFDHAGRGFSQPKTHCFPVHKAPQKASFLGFTRNPSCGLIRGSKRNEKQHPVKLRNFPGQATKRRFFLRLTGGKFRNWKSTFLGLFHSERSTKT